MKKINTLIICLMFQSCTSISCFSIDGKASMNCRRKKMAEDYCRSRGVKEYDYYGVKCK